MASPPALSAAAVEVERAIRVMYGDGGGGAPGAQQAALAWLVAYADGDAAWGVFPELVAGSASPAVQYYAANGVYTKVLRGWGALPPAQRAQVHGFLWSALGATAGGSASSGAITAAAPPLATPALRRLCMALASAAAQSRDPSGAAEYLRRAVAPLGELAHSSSVSSSGGAPPAVPLSVSLACLELLRCLPEAVADEAGRGIGRRGSGDAAAAMTAALRSSADGVLRALQAVLADDRSPLKLTAAADAATSPTALDKAAADAARLWLELSLCGPGALLARYAPLATALLDSVTSPGCMPAAAEAAVDALAVVFDNAAAAASRRRRGRGGGDTDADGALLAALEEDEAEGRADATAAVATALVAAVPQLQAWAAGGTTARLLPAARLAALVTSLQPDVEWWAGRGAVAPVPSPLHLHRFPHVSACLDAGSAPPTIDGGPVGVGALFADVLLQLAADGDPAVASTAAAGFYAVKFLSPPAVHPFLRWHAYAALARVLAGQCLYPLPPPTSGAAAAAGQSGASRRADPHAALAFRAGRHGSTLHEALGDCVAALGCAGYLAAVTSWLRSQQQHGQAPTSGRFSASSRALEAALFVTCSRAVIGPILDGLLRPPQSEDEAAAAAAAEGAAESLLTALVAAAAAQRPDAQPELLATGCAWVGRVGGVWLRETLAARGPAATVASAPATGSAPLPVAPLLQQALQLVGGCLTSPAAPLYAPPPRRDDLAALAAFTADAAAGGSVGGSRRPRAACERTAAGASGAEGDSSDDDGGSDEGEDDGSEAGSGSDDADSAPLSTCGADALCALLPALAAAGQHSLAPQLAGAVVDAYAAGVLPAPPAARALTALVRMVLVSLPPSRQTDELVATVQAPLVARLRGPAPAPSDAAAALALCRHVALAVALLSPLQEGRQPAAAGARAAADERTPLDATADALWRACEAALSGAGNSAAPTISGILLHGLAAVLRCCPAVAADGGGARLQAALSLGVQLFTARAHPGALTVVTAAVALLPALAPQQLPPPQALPPALQAACSQLAAAVLPAAASAAMSQQLPPETTESACRLVSALLSAAPAALVGQPAHLTAALALAAAGFATGDRGAARAAGDVTGALLVASRSSDAVATVASALGGALPSLARALLETLLVSGDVGGPGACAAVADTLHALLAAATAGSAGGGAAAGGRGAAAAALPPWAPQVPAAIANTLAQLAATAGGGGSGGPSDTATGLGCLTPGECAALVSAAGRLAAAGPRERRRFDVLWDDVRRLAARRGTRDALSAYGV